DTSVAVRRRAVKALRDLLLAGSFSKSAEPEILSTLLRLVVDADESIAVRACVWSARDQSARKWPHAPWLTRGWCRSASLSRRVLRVLTPASLPPRSLACWTCPRPRRAALQCFWKEYLVLDAGWARANTVQVAMDAAVVDR